MVNITPRPLNPLLSRRLGGPFIQSGRFGEELNLLPMLGFDARIVQSVRSIATIQKLLFLGYAVRPCMCACVHVFFNRVLPLVTVNSPLDQKWPNSRSRSLFRPYRSVFAASLPSVALRLIFFGSTYICEKTFSQMKINQVNKAA